MRRGIATFGFLARFAPAAAAVVTLVVYVGPSPPAPFWKHETPSSDRMERTSTLAVPPSSAALWPEFASADRQARGVRLSPQDLPGYTLADCRFACDWRGCDLRGVKLRDCDLVSAELEGADLRGCLYDVFTRWPAGFHPQAHGARLVE
jgi:hypothetical protein